MGRLDVVDLDDQRRDRVAPRLRRQQHLVGLEVGVDLGRLRDDVDQPLVGRARLAGQHALPDGVTGGVAGLVLVAGEQVEVLVALREVHAGVAHVRALPGGDDVEPLLGQPPAEVDRHPLHARVAADLDAAGGQVVDLAAAPVLVVREVDLRAGQRVQLERAGVQRLALEVGGLEELADLDLGVLLDDDQRVRPLRGTRLVDHPGDLDRVLDLHVLGHVHEHAAGPERSAAGGELVLVVGQALAEVLAHELLVLDDGLLEWHHGQSVVDDVGVDDVRAALDDQCRVLVVAQVELGQALLLALGLERLEVEAAQGRRPEAGAPPGRDRLAS